MTKPGRLDSAGPPNAVIWKTIVYGSLYQEFDINDQLIRSITLSGVTETDLNYFPLMYTDNIVVSDSVVGLFITGVTNNGQIVSDNGNTILLQTSFVEEGRTFDAEAVYDKNYLLPIQNSLKLNNLLYFTEKNEFSNVGIYRFRTKSIELMPAKAEQDFIDEVESLFPNSDYTPSFETESVKIVIYSNFNF